LDWKKINHSAKEKSGEVKTEARPVKGAVSKNRKGGAIFLSLFRRRDTRKKGGDAKKHWGRSHHQESFPAFSLGEEENGQTQDFEGKQSPPL